MAATQWKTVQNCILGGALLLVCILYAFLPAYGSVPILVIFLAAVPALVMLVRGVWGPEHRRGFVYGVSVSTVFSAAGIVMWMRENTGELGAMDVQVIGFVYGVTLVFSWTIGLVLFLLLLAGTKEKGAG